MNNGCLRQVEMSREGHRMVSELSKVRKMPSLLTGYVGLQSALGCKCKIVSTTLHKLYLKKKM
jgi:hypothetical protein